jgi:DNA-binding beta-propeller fold protein YncE
VGSPFHSPGDPQAVTIDASGQFAYVATGVGNTVAAYGIDSVTGALTALAGSPYSAGTYPYYVAIAPSGEFLYVANVHSANISAYALDSNTGVPTQIGGSPFAAGNFSGSVTVATAGRPLPNTKDDCKNGGWQQLGRGDGSPFKNQGACVSYVNTGK